ncbi:MAG: hypothetical protein J5646_08575 [Bacteroidales bacterium]|nr:hypothetical protein [Bacteroidales bacterium]
MKKLFLLLATIAILAACVNNNSSKKSKTSEEPSPVESEEIQEPAQQPVQQSAQPLIQQEEPVKAEAQEPEVQAQEAAPEEVAPVEEKPRTVDALCKKYGVYGLLSQYDRYLKAGEKKKAKKIEDQLWEIEKRVKNDKTLPEKLRDSFKDYVEDKEDEIEDRY